MAEASYYDNTFIPSQGGRVEQTVHSVVHRMFGPFRRAAKFHSLCDELNACSDRDLCDIGISRYDIKRIAFEGSRDA